MTIEDQPPTEQTDAQGLTQEEIEAILSSPESTPAEIFAAITNGFASMRERLHVLQANNETARAEVEKERAKAEVQEVERAPAALTLEDARQTLGRLLGRCEDTVEKLLSKTSPGYYLNEQFIALSQMPKIATAMASVAMTMARIQPPASPTKTSE